MKEFTSLLKVTPVGSSVSIVFEFMADHYDFTPSVSDDEGGASWNCDKTFTIDKPDSSAIDYFRIPRLAIVTLTTSDRVPHQVGTDDIPARVHIVEHLQKAQLIMRCVMLSNPLS